jgi:hypothetical protein
MVKQFNQQLFNIDNQLKAAEEGLREAIVKA